MTREELEREIASIAGDIEILNRKIAEVTEYVKERDRLRERLNELTQWYVGECFRDRATSDMKQCIFAYKGKIKDLLKKLEKERIKRKQAEQELSK